MKGEISQEILNALKEQHGLSEEEVFTQLRDMGVDKVSVDGTVLDSIGHGDKK